MNIFTLAVLIGVLTLAVGALLMWMVVGLSTAVANNEVTIATQEKTRKSINPKNTGGFAITGMAGIDEQLSEARKLAARIAARKKRGANMGIGRAGTVDVKTDKKHVSSGIAEDPLNAVKIARYHTWNGLQVVKSAAAAPVARAAGGATKVVKRKLVAGKDYPVTPLGDAKGAAKRTILAANAKAKYAAYKAAKAAGLDTMTVTEGAAPVAAAVAAAPAIELPPAPTMVKITDDMEAADKRKAKIGNSKAKSAYNKQLKALGINPKEVKWTDDGPVLPAAANAAVEAAQAAAVAAPAAVAAAPVAAASSVELPPAPEMTVITDDMDGAAKRAAKIGNTKAKSAYNKELKALGINPKEVEWTDAGPRMKVAAAPVAAAAAAAPVAAAPAGAPPPPELIEITDDMPNDEKRSAKIANSKAKSAYKKELKALGIDPKSVKI